MGRQRRFIVGITGASGAAVSVSLLRALLSSGDVEHISLVLSDHAMPVMAQELDAPQMDGAGFIERFLEGDRRVQPFRNDQLAAPIASGSHPTDGMIVAPCSVHTLASIAAGFGGRLMDRAADVTLKEKRPLLLAVRETPFNATHLENMLRVTRNGATVFPVCPAFYARPRDIQDMVDNFVLRLLDHVGVAGSGFRWGQGKS